MPFGRRQRVRRRRVVAAGAAYAVHKHHEHQQQEQMEAERATYERDAPPPQQVAPSAPDPVAQLKELAQLHDSGVLTDTEFDAEKQKILGR